MSEKQKMVVVVTRGFDDERASVAWSVANGGVGMGFEVTMFLVSAGSYPTPWSKNDWGINAVADQPRWQALMTRVRAELKVQRERLAAEGRSAP